MAACIVPAVALAFSSLLLFGEAPEPNFLLKFIAGGFMVAPVLAALVAALSLKAAYLGPDRRDLWLFAVPTVWVAYVAILWLLAFMACGPNASCRPRYRGSPPPASAMRELKLARRS